MRVCVVGGIFGRSKPYREKCAITPETVLADGLRARGVEVKTLGHTSPLRFDGCDIVHVHHLGAGALHMAATARTVPFIFTPHDPLVFCGYDRSLKMKLAHWYVRRHCDALVALSQQEAQYLTTITRGRQCIEVIPNGVPEKVFYPAAEVPDRRPKPWSILYVGQLVEFKGVDVLLKALQRIIRTWDAELLLVYHNSHLEQHYKALADTLGITERVRFMGFKSQDELSALHRRSDVLVVASRAECLPSVITEALLSGLPVVATQVGGIPEQVGAYGKIVPPENPAALSDAIVATFQELSTGEDRRMQRRQYALSKYSVQSMVDNHLQLYKRMIQITKTPKGAPFLSGHMIRGLLMVLTWKKRFTSKRSDLAKS